MTARAKGCSERQVLYGHVFRNAMLIVIAGFPGAFIHAFFSGSLLIETIFSLDGLGLLGFESVLNRDYPVVFGNALHLLAGRPGGEPDLRPHLHVDRSAHRFRGAGGLMTMHAPPADRDHRRSRRSAMAVPIDAPPLRAVAAQPAALAEFQGQPARLLVVLDLPGPVRRLAVRRVHRQRQAVPDQVSTASLYSRPSSPIPRRRSAATSRPRPTIAIPICRS